MNMSEAIARVVIGGNLSQDEMTEIMKLIMTGEATASQIGGFLVGLQIKGETVDEISGAALVMRELAMKVEVDTTGDGSNDHVLLARRMDLRPSTVSETTCTDKGLSVASSASAPSAPAIETIINFGTSDEPTGGSLVSTEVCVVDNILSGAAGCPTE